MEESESSGKTPQATPLDSKTPTSEDYLSVHLSHIELRVHGHDHGEGDGYDDDIDDDDDGDSYSGEHSDDSSSGDSDDSDLSMMDRLRQRFGALPWEPYDADEYEESFNRTQANSDAEDAPEELAVVGAGETLGAQEAMQLSSLLRSHLRKINSRNSSPMHEHLAPVAKVPSGEPEAPAKSHERHKRKQRRAHAAFEKGALKTRVECRICLTPIRQLHARLCCSFDACNRCMKSYVEEKVRSGCVHIECPNDRCTKLIHRDEIMARLSGRELRDKFQQFLVDANNEVNRKTCPRCSHVKTFDLQLFKSSKTRPRLVTCDKCELQWCFGCHAPWHEGLKCAKFQKGDVFLKKWAKEECKGQKNAQRCPKCNVYIQRSKGCDHMTCSQCKAEFCYKCGEQFRKFLFIGKFLNIFKKNLIEIIEFSFVGKILSLAKFAQYRFIFLYIITDTIKM